MIREALAATGISALCFIAVANAADAPVRKAPAQSPAVPAAVERVQDCSDFFDAYHSRGFGWGSSPASDIGFGAFEGAVGTYAWNSFPNWYGLCATWGHYSATGAAR